LSRETNKHKTKQQKKNLAICVPDKTISNKEGLGYLNRIKCESSSTYREEEHKNGDG
jgi:hypothetical protein